jgi:hypothetical protein
VLGLPWICPICNENLSHRDSHLLIQRLVLYLALMILSQLWLQTTFVRTLSMLALQFLKLLKQLTVMLFIVLAMLYLFHLHPCQIVKDLRKVSCQLARAATWISAVRLLERSSIYQLYALLSFPNPQILIVATFNSRMLLAASELPCGTKM